jgi:ferredoxin
MSPTPPAFCPIYECHLHDNIELLPYSEVVKVEGREGDFNVAVIRKPRFVDPKRCTLCEACIKVCPVEVEREFGGGLEKRKAIYLPYPQAIPHRLVIDPKTCTRCGECVKVCSPGAIDLDMKEEEEKIEEETPGEETPASVEDSGAAKEEPEEVEEEVKEEERLAVAGKFYSMGRGFLLAEDYERALPFFVETVRRNPNLSEGFPIHFQKVFALELNLP